MASESNFEVSEMELEVDFGPPFCPDGNPNSHFYEVKNVDKSEKSIPIRV